MRWFALDSAGNGGVGLCPEEHDGTENRFDDDEQFVVWEASCPDWQIPDIGKAYRFAADWMRHHPKDAVIVDEKSRRITWRRSFRTEWVEDDDALDTLSQLYLTDSMGAATECLNAAKLALGGF